VSTKKEHISDKSLNRKSIYSLTPFTLIDYPDKTSCVLWFAGCNMRCSYCYNPEIVLGKGKLSFYDIRDFLYSRRDLLDGVVLSGGECLLHDSVKDILIAIKEMKFLIKIDTNGSRPKILKQFINNQLIDYVSLDFKATKAKTFQITKADFYAEFVICLGILLKSDIQFEVRTTVHSALLDQNDIDEMVITLTELGYRGKYYIQHYRNESETIGNPGPSFINFNVKDCINQDIQIILR